MPCCLSSVWSVAQIVALACIGIFCFRSMITAFGLTNWGASFCEQSRCNHHDASRVLRSWIFCGSAVQFCGSAVVLGVTYNWIRATSQFLFDTCSFAVLICDRFGSLIWYVDPGDPIQHTMLHFFHLMLFDSAYLISFPHTVISCAFAYLLWWSL